MRRAILTGVGAGLLLASSVQAQVSVNPSALDQLKPSTPAASPTPTKPAQAAQPTRPAAKSAKRASRSPARAETSKQQKSQKPRSQPVAVAPAPPPVAALPPPVEAPHPVGAVPSPPIPVVANAVGEFTPIPGGIRVTFGPATADLNPNTANAIRQIAREVKATPAVDVNVFAYAAGAPDDPSTPRRLSLSRALAARAVLISEGIVSTRIYVRALGAAAVDGPPERVDVVRAGTEAKP